MTVHEGVVGEDVGAGPAVRRAPRRALIAAVRPKQWLKNVLVGAVPAAAGQILKPEIMGRTALAFVAFCLAASATYLLNDVGDREADARHPIKCRRPIAAGELSVRAALTACVVAALAAVGVAAIASLALAGGVAGYMALTAAYSRGLKHEPVFDIAAVAAGFFLRTVAGGLATDIYVSRWFLIVAAGASLFVVAGKRYAEFVAQGDAAAATRRVLAQYSADYLRSVTTLASSITILAYCLWAFEDSGDLSSGWRAVSVFPFVLAMLRYGLLLDQGHGEEPEQIFMGDRTLQGIAVFWLLLLALGVLL